MSDEQTVVVMDEAGNTGENLLDPEQPVFALAALHIPKAHADTVVSAAVGRTQMVELKFSSLRRSNRGRRNVLTLLADAGLTQDVAATAVAHKPWMLAAKLVDGLVEPTMLARGEQLDWYGSGAALEMAEVLYTRGPRALGEYYDNLCRAFVPLVRDYTPAVAAEFLTALRQARIVCRDDLVSGVLERMVDTEEGLAEEFSGQEDALDPAVPLLFYQGGHWSQQQQRPFEFMHDESHTIDRWRDRFIMVERANNPDAPVGPARRRLGPVEALFPTGLQRISFGQSERDSRLQLADIVAGATAHLTAALSGARPTDAFARDLNRLGLMDLVIRWVGPDFDPVAAARLH